MITPYGYQDVDLLARDGSLVARARVPNQPLLPQIVIWSQRYFRLLSVNTNYVEATCYLVPIENMYASGGPAASKASGEPKK